MINIETQYMGMTLKNPIIVSSSKMTSTLKGIQKCEEAGAGAVIVKSLFEEQISADQKKMVSALDASVYTDAWDFFQASSENYFFDEYASLIEDAIKSLTIPVIPSLNCTSNGNWVEYAKRFEQMGVSAIEFNLFIMPANTMDTGAEIESQYIDICKSLKKLLKIPFSVKLGSYFSGMANMIKRLSNEIGVDALVLFNRFYRYDINIEKMKLIPGNIFSHPSEMGLTLQWIALMSGEVKADLIANTGIYTGVDLIKQLLAGAKGVEICSALYQDGFELINRIKLELIEWMTRHQFSSLDDFRGILCQQRSTNPEQYERVQYIKALTGIH